MTRVLAYSIVALLVYIIGRTLPNLSFIEEVIVVSVVVVICVSLSQSTYRFAGRTAARIKSWQRRRTANKAVITEVGTVLHIRRLEADLKEARDANALLTARNSHLSGENRKLSDENQSLHTRSPNSDEIDWESLVTMDDAQRRQWAKAGAKFAKMSDGTSLSAAERATRWVRDNRVDREH